MWEWEEAKRGRSLTWTIDGSMGVERGFMFYVWGTRDWAFDLHPPVFYVLM